MNRKKTKKQKLMGEADHLWYQKYLKDCCEVCGDSYILQAHHFYYRSGYGFLRYLKENHITLCRRCHFRLHAQDPKKIEDLIIAKRGQRWYNNLKAKSRKSLIPSYKTIEYYLDIIKTLES